jgi:hypothetical protein
VNPFEFVIAIIFLTGIFGLIKHRMNVRHRWEQPEGNNGETLRLRQEVGELKERIKVLERIAVDKENALAKEIESLRDS